jgi:hypothetical protein
MLYDTILENKMQLFYLVVAFFIFLLKNNEILARSFLDQARKLTPESAPKKKSSATEQNQVFLEI